MNTQTWSPEIKDFEELRKLVSKDKSIKYFSWSLEGIHLTRKVEGEKIHTLLPQEETPKKTLAKAKSFIRSNPKKLVPLSTEGQISKKKSRIVGKVVNTIKKIIK